MPLSRTVASSSTRRYLTAASVLALLLVPALSLALPCVQPDSMGTVRLPPVGCGYLSPQDVHRIIDGLPPGTTIEIGAEHRFFTNIVNFPGGSLGGEVERFDSHVLLQMTGTGALSGFNRTIELNAGCETHTGPRISGAPIQSFDTDMFMMQGQLPPGDPDFDLLQITAGTSFGMPSPGHTTLTQLPGGNWSVDSFFDITYRIEFSGAPGGPLSGMSGSTTGTIRMQAGEPTPIPPCTVVDNGTGTVDLPPQGCGYVSPTQLHQMIDGLPPGTTIQVAAEHRGFAGVSATPGGALGGEIENFQSTLQLLLTGTGELVGYERQIPMEIECETHTGPRIPGEPVQSFDALMMFAQGQIGGDPDFQSLQITAGDGFGLPSPGHTTLTQNATAGGTWNVDSFFDITYNIAFVGAPGGPLGGLSGSTIGTLRMQCGQPAAGPVGAPMIDQPHSREIALANRPNPFSPGTTIEYRLEQSSNVSLDVYDVGGHRVRNLLEARLAMGPHAMYWDGRDDSGKKLATGVYFIKISVNGQVAGSTKATMLK